MARRREGGRICTGTPAELVAEQERHAAALELFRDGKDYPAIAQELGYAHRAGAYRAVQSALLKIVKPAGEQVLKLELERLERYQQAVDEVVFAVTAVEPSDDPDVIESRIETRLKAIIAGLRVMERRAKYLGLDAPEKRELTGKDGGPIMVTLGDIDQALAAADANEPSTPSLPERGTLHS